jgi:hypothetical protein
MALDPLDYEHRQVVALEGTGRAVTLVSKTPFSVDDGFAFIRQRQGERGKITESEAVLEYKRPSDELR